MSEFNESQEGEIVDLDNCSKKKSILIGALVALLLGFVHYSYLFFFIHFVIGGLAGAGHFAKRHSISITGGTGLKIGAVSAFLGMLPVLVFVIGFLYTGFGDAEFETVREEIVRTMYEDGNPEAAEYAENAVLADLKPAIAVAFAAAGSVFSLVLGSFGGLLGSALFKKGPLAQ